MESTGRILLVYLEGTLSSKIFPPQKAGYFESEMPGIMGNMKIKIFC
jgi:hypothetical protein